jgi:hypothetical protein
MLGEALLAPDALSSLALAHGYFDQSHLTNESHALSGLPMGQLLARIDGGDPGYWSFGWGATCCASRGRCRRGTGPIGYGSARPSRADRQSACALGPGNGRALRIAARSYTASL